MKLAFVFPGQGSQSVGMLAHLAESHPEVEATYQEASDALGYDLWGLVQNGPDAELMLTERTQPAMLAAGVAVWRVWCRLGGLRPEVMAGHSLGEYTALVCAESMSFREAVTLVADRGRFMQDAVPRGRGAIAAIIGLDDHQIASICESAADVGVVSAVNFNAPTQVVIAGHTEAVERAVALGRKSGAKRAVILPMSVPAHSPLMEPVADRFRQRLADVAISSPTTPVIHNVDLSRRTEPDEVREMLARQLYSPVRWADTIRQVAKDGISTVIECGPGKVLSALTRRIERHLSVLPVCDAETLTKALGFGGLPGELQQVAS
jgi:[acyl-carrier-protein] S-malonyltransferase